MADKKKKAVSFIMPAALLLMLLPVFVLMTLDRVKQQEKLLLQQFVEKGASLIKTFEAGTRAGMRNMHWGAQRIQLLLSETASQPEVAYMMIITSEGRILSHSDPLRIGQTARSTPDFQQAVQDPTVVYHRVVISDEPGGVLEVYKRFKPLHRPRKHRRMGMKPPEKFMVLPREEDEKDLNDWSHQYRKGADSHYVIVGLTMEPLNALKQQFFRQEIFRGGGFFLSACAAVAALFAFSSYRSAKLSLKKVKAFSDLVVQYMPAGLLTVDHTDNVSVLNDVARSMLNGDVTPLKSDLKQMIDEMDNGASSVTREVVVSSESNGKALIEVTGSRPENEMEGKYIFLLRDLTQIKSLQQQVETNKRLAAIGKLAAGVAHEIRNPLSSIKGFATYFGRRKDNSDTDRQTADIMVKEVERINRSVTQLLEFSKPMQIEKQTVDIKKLIQHSVLLIQPDMNEKQIRVKTRFEPDISYIQTDPDRLNQVLLNLYINAVEAMDKAGSLTVELSRTDTGDTLIRIMDDGEGMDKETLDHLFDPYFTTRSTGTGLGLSIVHRIVENLGGMIRVESVKNEGTCFQIVLPKGDTG